MAEIAVPRAEVAKLVGLPADATDEELQKAMADLLAVQAAQEAESVAAAAEAREVAEDKRIVAAAVADGRLPANRAEFWCAALKNGNREANRAVVGMLTPGWRSPERVALDNDLERIHAKVMAQFGGAPQPRTVAASDGFGRQPGENLPAPYRSPDVPAPVVIQKGVSPADWTPKQAQDAMLRRLGPRFHPGTEAPPKGDVVYFPSPNDVSAFDESTGEWIQKQPFREIP
jgi:hypothetical protein